MTRHSMVFIIVRTTFVGFHHWPGAPAHRDYLAQRHRHLFHVEVSMDVSHDDREVEFHDLLDFVNRQADRYGEELGAQSCEHLCRRFGDAIMDKWPTRTITVSVFEDGEAGARVTWSPLIGGTPDVPNK